MYQPGAIDWLSEPWRVGEVGGKDIIVIAGDHDHRRADRLHRARKLEARSRSQVQVEDRKLGTLVLDRTERLVLPAVRAKHDGSCLLQCFARIFGKVEVIVDHEHRATI